MRYILSEIIALIVGGAVAVFIMMGVNNGEFTPLLTTIASELGLSTGTTSVGRFPTFPSGSTDTASAASVSTLTENWSGYEAAGGSYTAIRATWAVPSVSSSSTESADATWIGIGGSGTQDLIQIGTENTIVNGGDQLIAFYEELPAYAQPIDAIALNPGDSITASLTETGTGVWELSMRDITTGQAFSKTVEYASSNSSAEWIQEAPSSTTAIIPLDDFGSVTFSGASTTVNGQSESIAASGAQAISMENANRQLLTEVSTLNANGDGFTVSRTNAPSTTTGGTTFRREPGFRRWFGA